jgi:uncharacterized protein
MNLLNSVLENASNGKLVTSFCRKCNMYIWPPNYACSLCNSKASLREIKRDGILLEKARSFIAGKEGSFGIGEFNGIRLIGTINEDARVGKPIRIQEIGLRNGRLDLRFTDLSS